MQIFAGSSNPDLAEKIAKLSKIKLGQMELSHFDNGEARIRITEQRVEKDILLVQSLSQPVDQHLLEFCLIADALTRKGASNITAVVPWLGYSKQDKVFLPGEPLSAKVVAQIIQTTKVKKIITFDLHNRAILGFFDIPVTELSAKPIFLDYFKKKMRHQSLELSKSSELENEVVVVAPDEGAVKTSAYFARELGVPIVYMDKRRDLKSGKVKVVGMSGKVEGTSVVIVDDMIVTGSTVMETARYLKQNGAKSVEVAATHHLYVPGVQEKIDRSQLDQVAVTDTVAPNGKGKQKILSVAQQIVDEIAQI